MSIERKWAIARAAVYAEDGIIWVAESRAGTGTWLMRENEDEDNNWPQDEEGRDSPVYGLKGAFFPFAGEHEGVILYMTKEQREHIGMPDDVYHRLEVDLELSYQEKEKRTAETRANREWTADTDPHAVLSQLPPAPPRTPDMLEGYEFEHVGLRLRRENQRWVVVDTGTVDQAVRKSLNIKTETSP